MLTEREVLSTLNMLRNEHLDVRTVTLGISLFDCVSHDFDVFSYKVRAKIAKYAAHLVETCNEVGARYGIPVVNKRISISPMAVVGAGFNRDQMVRACQMLDEAAKDAGVDFLGGFGALVEKGMTPGDIALIEALPEALATTDRICSSINVASSKAGINMDAVALMGRQILKVADATSDRDGIGCAKLVVFANIPQDVPFMAGAYLGIGEPDVVINVGVSGPGVVKKAIDRAKETHSQLTLSDVAEVIKSTAYKVTRVGELIGKEVASRMNLPFGVADLSLAPTPAVGDSVGEIFQSVGLSSIGAPGSTAVLAMLNDAVKKGGVFASSHVGGLSGAFIPVSEDSSIEAAANCGALTMEKLEAMTSVCSVGLDMIAIPGDTPASTISGLIADEMAIGMINSKTTAVLAMLNDAVKKGGVFASSHVGGLSGAFIPVSEDSSIEAAANCGALTMEKLEAMTSVCSVGLDMIAIPGDTPASTISGLIADEMAIGMINSKTTAVRIIPVPGKGVGDTAVFGGLLGKAKIIPVHTGDASAFIGLGGRIPAPIHSLKN